MDDSLRYSLDEVKDDDDAELLRKLKLAWGYDFDASPFRIICKLEKVIPRNGKPFYVLSDLRSTVNFDAIKYPIDLDRSVRKIDTIYIPPQEAASIKKLITDNDWIITNVGLSSKKDRVNRRNPFALEVTGNVDVLIELPQEAFKKIDNDDASYVEKKIVDFYINKNREEIELAGKSESQRLYSEHENFKKNIDSLSDEKGNLQSEIDNQNKTKNSLESKVSLLSHSIISKSSELDELEKTYITRKTLMESNLSRLNEFVKTRALELSKLDLVSDNDLQKLLGKQGEKDKAFSYLTINDDFSGDLSKTVKYIQSYMHHRDIFYKQDILKDFLALLRTNDLIILAGDSGSGKTNLVKSMADAIGGKAIIIPVKPNWTSSEDLLGYYNPLEKKYLSTPFLDALIEATKYPNKPYLICLDEMNLARVEYYFADFLSLLEERSELPDIYLYSDAEADHALSEFKTFLRLIDEVKTLTGKEDISDYLGLLKDEEVNQAINKICGFNGGDSLLKYHSHLRRMLSGFLNTPSSIKLPDNVRIIGAINVDETTHYLSPKILDRAHVIRFSSPLLYKWEQIDNEIEEFDSLENPILFSINELGVRAQYPKFDRNHEFAKFIMEITEKFLNSLGLEIGFRSVRQALNYHNELSQLEVDNTIIMNNFILHKILPKLMFDGEQISGEAKKKNILEAFRNHIEERLSDIKDLSGVDYCVHELDRVIENAKSNNWVVNYWSK